MEPTMLRRDQYDLAAELGNSGARIARARLEHLGTSRVVRHGSACLGVSHAVGKTGTAIELGHHDRDRACPCRLNRIHRAGEEAIADLDRVALSTCRLS